MTQVAGVGPASVHTLADRGIHDGVAADGLQQAVGRVRHVAVVADAPGRIGGVMTVGRDVGAQRLMALQAGGVVLRKRLVCRALRVAFTTDS